jgi:hypothetical protein
LELSFWQLFLFHLIGVPVLALCIFLVPEIGNVVAKLLPEFAYIKYLVSIVFFASGLPFYFALYHAFKLLHFIDKNKAFSELSVNALKKIKYCAITISSLHVLVLPLFYLFAEKDDFPGVIFIGLIVLLLRWLSQSLRLFSKNLYKKQLI